MVVLIKKRHGSSGKERRECKKIGGVQRGKEKACNKDSVKCLTALVGEAGIESAVGDTNLLFPDC